MWKYFSMFYLNYFIFSPMHDEHWTTNIFDSINIRKNIIKWSFLQLFVNHSQTRCESWMHYQSSNRITLIWHQSHTGSWPNAISVHNYFCGFKSQLKHQELICHLNTSDHIKIWRFPATLSIPRILIGKNIDSQVIAQI